MCICVYVCVLGGGGCGVVWCVRDGVPLRHLQVFPYKACEIFVASTRCPSLQKSL